MSIIQAYKSDTDGELFEHLKDYKSHLKYLATNRFLERKADKKEKARKAFVQNMHDTVSSPQELADFILNNSAFFASHVIPSEKNTEPLKFTRVVFHSDHKKLADNEFTWNNEVSCTHNSPIGKPTNWGVGRPDLPRNYPGWTAHIEYEMNGESRFGSEIFGRTGINTGGGNGGKVNHYTLDIFAEDFKKMAYCDLIKNIQKTNSVDIKRLQHVLELSYEFVNKEELNHALSEVIKKSLTINPALNAVIMDLTLSNKIDNLKQIKI